MSRETKEALHAKGFTGGNEFFEGVMGRVPPEERDATILNGPQPEAYHWQWKIKQILDPNDAGGPEYLTFAVLPKLKKNRE